MKKDFYVVFLEDTRHEIEILLDMIGELKKVSEFNNIEIITIEDQEDIIETIDFIKVNNKNSFVVIDLTLKLPDLPLFNIGTPLENKGTILVKVISEINLAIEPIVHSARMFSEFKLDCIKMNLKKIKFYPKIDEKARFEIIELIKLNCRIFNKKNNSK